MKVKGIVWYCLALGVLINLGSYLWTIGSDNFQLLGNAKYYEYGWPLRCYFPIENAYNSETYISIVSKVIFNCVVIAVAWIAINILKMICMLYSGMRQSDGQS